MTARKTLAASVVEQIRSLGDQEAALGLALNQALLTPPQAAPAPPGSEAVVATEMQAGGSAADALGGVAILDSLV